MSRHKKPQCHSVHSADSVAKPIARLVVPRALHDSYTISLAAAKQYAYDTESAFLASRRCIPPVSSATPISAPITFSQPFRSAGDWRTIRGKGRLWVICTRCGRWNLTPLDERWEAIDDAERLFRGTRLRMSTDNIGLACFRESFELVRIGPALLPEIASWRYGARLARLDPDRVSRADLFVRGAHLIARATAAALVGYAHGVGFSDDAVLQDADVPSRGRTCCSAYRTSTTRRSSSAMRTWAPRNWCAPSKDSPWQLQAPPRHRLRRRCPKSPALRVAGKMLATLNFGVASQAEVQHAISKLDAAGDPEGYFTRVASLAMRTSWGRFPDAPSEEEHPRGTFAERLALQLANRSFWGRGGTGSEEQTPLYRLPAVDRLSLEMAANEDIERQALRGELDALHAAWRDAEEIAAIADGLFTDDVLEEFKRQYHERIAAGDAS